MFISRDTDSGKSRRDDFDANRSRAQGSLFPEPAPLPAALPAANSASAQPTDNSDPSAQQHIAAQSNPSAAPADSFAISNASSASLLDQAIAIPLPDSPSNRPSASPSAAAASNLSDLSLASPVAAKSNSDPSQLQQQQSNLQQQANSQQPSNLQQQQQQQRLSNGNRDSSSADNQKRDNLSSHPSAQSALSLDAGDRKFQLQPLHAGEDVEQELRENANRKQQVGKFNQTSVHL